MNDNNRPGVGLDDNGIPDIAWVEIPAGEFIYQDDQTIYLPAFSIARYPVTYAQFQAFMNAEDGFANRDWWDGLTVDDPHALYDPPSGDQQFRFDDHPCDNVAWHDAVAFCRWLSARTGEPITLPTEQQWEKAARGTDGQIYPYAGDFNPAKGNTRKTGLGQTSAAGRFPEGASPFGVLDMSGNVWEWCLNEYHHPERTETTGSELRVLRGGSCDSHPGLARCTFRIHNYYLPDPHGTYFGFRLCRLSHRAQ